MLDRNIDLTKFAKASIISTIITGVLFYGLIQILKALKIAHQPMALTKEFALCLLGGLLMTTFAIIPIMKENGQLKPDSTK